MRKQRLLQEAEFAPSVVRYHVLASCVMLALSLVGILLIPLALPIAYLYYTRYYGALGVRLTTRELQVRRGILMVEEKSIPLEKITDLAVYDGPIMRHLGLKGIRVETAGQSGGAGGALVTVVGIVGTEEFRDQVLEQRDRIADADDAPPSHRLESPTAAAGDAAVLATLVEIREVLERIESALSTRSTPEA